ncbi:MAG: hypothetical protein JNJ90_05090 [Saprospiraceae bacterium]|jgi:hypothetical protein|nr:hypothetical protein [Saprospiraceae bacterium]
MKKFTSTRLVSHTIALFGAPMFCIALLVAVCTTGLQAQTTPQISVQGTLKTASGTPAPDGTQTVTFRLYNVETGGTHLWEETADVEIVGGIYSHYLGSVTPLNAANFANTLYLAVKVGSYELTPRNRLAYAPYAFSVYSAVCSGAVGDIKFSILNPTDFALENGPCWVPMKGQSLAGSKLAQYTGSYNNSNLPDGSGRFIRAQEFPGSPNNIDDDRDSNTPIGQAQGESFRGHNHTMQNAGAHTHTIILGHNRDDEGGGGGPDDWSFNDGSDDGSRPPRDISTVPGHSVSTNGSHTHTIDPAGGTETRPDNLNFWIYIRIN